MNRIFEPLHYFSPTSRTVMKQKREVLNLSKKTYYFLFEGVWLQWHSKDIQKLKPADESMPVLDDFLLVNNVKVHWFPIYQLQNQYTIRASSDSYLHELFSPINHCN